LKKYKIIEFWKVIGGGFFFLFGVSLLNQLAPSPFPWFVPVILGLATLTCLFFAHKHSLEPTLGQIKKGHKAFVKSF
jgi:hypothetical protein